MRTLIELFSNFSFPQIILFIILLAIVVKELVEFIDWIKSRNKKEYEERKIENELARSNEERLDKLETNMVKMSENINNINDKVDLLINSDRDDIKAFITREHHYFCYKMKWIDDYSLDCLEHRFQHYKEEEGNSFIEGLMKELRALPKTDPEQHK